MRFRLPLAVMLAVLVSITAAFAAGPFFKTVTPIKFAPDHTPLIQSTWLSGIGCPTNAKLSPSGTFTDTACSTGDPKDNQVQGLLLAKTGPTSNNAAAFAELKNVKGITLTDLGYDIRKSSAEGSHCGAGAPRFNVVTTDGVTHFVGCSSPAPAVDATSDGWLRLRWRTAQLAAAFPAILPTDTVKQIFIAFDEGQDLGPTNSFGAAILDNIDVNGTLIGQGPASEQGDQRPEKDGNGEKKDRH